MLQSWPSEVVCIGEELLFLTINIYLTLTFSGSQTLAILLKSKIVILGSKVAPAYPKPCMYCSNTEAANISGLRPRQNLFILSNIIMISRNHLYFKKMVITTIWFC